jgi:hypothetical protein
MHIKCAEIASGVLSQERTPIVSTVWVFLHTGITDCARWGMNQAQGPVSRPTIKSVVV